MDFQQALQQIVSHQIIVVHRHTNPDGDAIGAQTGLKLLLQHNFPEKQVFAVGDSPKRYGFVEGSTPDQVPDGVIANALAIVLDTSAKHLISDQRYQTAADTLRFDHHLFVEQICRVEVVDTSFESCCGLVAHFAMQCNLHIPQSAARALFTGMVTDSGRFRYDSTTPRTFQIAANLLQSGFSLNDVYPPLYAEEFSSVKLRAQFVLQVQFSPNNVAYIYTPLPRVQQFAQQGVDAFSISRGMVGVMSDIKGVEIWANFTETEEGVLCELRSKRHNINAIAVRYGGGGHLKASGATLPNKQVAMQLLADLDELAAQ